MGYLSKIIQLDQTQFTKLLSGQSISQNGSTINSYDSNTVYLFDKFVPEWAHCSNRAIKADNAGFSRYSKFSNKIKVTYIGSHNLNQWGAAMPLAFVSHINDYELWGNSYGSVRYTEDVYYDWDDETLYSPNFCGYLAGTASSANSVRWDRVTNKPAATGSVSVPVYWTGSGFGTCIVSFGNSSYGEHNANNVTDNGIKYYTSNGPSTSIGASTTDGALYSQAYSSTWVAQIAQDYRNGGLYVRGKNNGTWQSWYTVLDTRNWTSIVDGRYVKKTGDTMTGQLYINLNQDVGLNQNGSFIIGDKQGENIGIDGNEIMARNNSEAATLYLQADGGNLYSYASTNYFSDAVGIGTTNPSYKLHISGDSYANGWVRAGTSTNNAGFYCEGTGVHYTHQGTVGEIDMTSNNEFLWGSSGSTLYFNYRGVSRGTTVTNYIWNAGSSTSYASHTLGNLTSYGTISSYPNNNLSSSTTYTYPGGAYYSTEYPNFRLYGDNNYGLSTIEFVSQKGSTSINKPSDCAFIQLQPYGYSSLANIGSYPGLNSSGESNKLIIGVNNDSDDKLILQTPSTTGLLHVVGSSSYTIWDSGNDGSDSGLDADTVDGYHASSFSLTSHTHSVSINGSTKTIAASGGTSVDLGTYHPWFKDSSLNANSEDVGWHDVANSITNAAHSNHSSLIYVNNVGTPYQLQIPDSSVLYIYKRWYSGGSWSAWSKISSGYADSAGNADTVDGYHASSLWRSDGGVWNPSANITLGATANGQEWSFDISRNGYTGCYWHVWDSAYGSMLQVTADNGKVRAPYGFVGNLSGTADYATYSTTIRSITSSTNSKFYLTFVDSNNSSASYEYLYTNANIFFNPGLGSFGNGLNVTASGLYSHAEGDNTQATGDHSHAEGDHTIAYGTHAHSEGESTEARGGHSHTEGKLTKATGANAHAEGYGSEAQGVRSHAEGSYTIAQGLHSHSESYESRAYGAGSHAEGYNTIAGRSGYNTLSDEGHCSHAEGQETQATGSNSHAEGYNSIASGRYAHAQNYYTTASGYYSHTQGNHTSATADQSFAGGYYTEAKHTNEVAFGKYNLSNSDTIFSIGGGASGSRLNLFEVTTGGTLMLIYV